VKNPGNILDPAREHAVESSAQMGANLLSRKIFSLGKTNHEYTGCLATIPAMFSIGDRIS
jgi:hypothetical protein